MILLAFTDYAHRKYITGQQSVYILLKNGYLCSTVATAKLGIWMSVNDNVFFSFIYLLSD